MTIPEEQLLLNTFLFRGLTPEQLDSLLNQIPPTQQSYARHEVIYGPETYRRELGIILAGRIRVSKGNLLVSELATGDLFGAAALFNREVRYVSELTALEPCRILFFSQDGIQEMMDLLPTVAVNYVRYLSGRIRFLSSKIDALTQDSGHAKLSTWLLQQMSPDGTIPDIGPMNRLAQRLGISRATLYREMERLQGQGILTRSGKHVTIISPEQLREEEKE